MALVRSRHVASAFALALALGVASSGLLTRDADMRASMTTLTGVDGSVLVRHGDGSFAPAHEGDVIVAGDEVRTANGASAELTYFEGSSVRLTGDSLVVVQSLDGVGLMPKVVRVWHAVTELVRGNSRYNVRTPTSTASVRG